MIVPLLRSWLVVSSVLASALGEQGMPRAAIRPPATSVLSGVVVSADAARTPIRRVTITLSGGDITTLLAVTGDDGRFAFRNLPAGRYTLSAARPGFITTAFGATTPGRAGTPIALAAGQQLTNLSLRLLRGGVITGTVTDERGEPARGVQVGAVPVITSSATGRRTLRPGLRAGMFMAGIPPGGTVDDRGVFRIYGLAPGQYAVVALVNRQSDAVLETSEVEFQRAVQAVRSGPGTVVPATAVRSTGAPVRASPAAPVFFPGTFTAAQARIIDLGPAEEAAGIDFAVRVAPTGRVHGSVVGPDGQPAPGVTVHLLAMTGGPVIGPMGPTGVTSDRDGRFSFAGVSPGTHMLAVQPSAAPGGGPMLWARTSVAIDGRDVEASLTLQPAVQVTGHVVFESHGVVTRPADASRVRVTMMAVLDEGEYAPNPAPATTDTAGAFAFAGLTPGRYRFQFTAPGGTPSHPGWFLKSATLQGRDVLDAPLEIGATDVAGLLMTLTDRPIEVSGAIQDANGRPAPEYFVIAFPRHRALWSRQSPRIQQVRPGTDGSYLLRGLPPGDYLIAVATDVQAGELYDREFLAHLVTTAVPITVADGDTKVLNMRVK
jgi:hypothetical protein